MSDASSSKSTAKKETESDIQKKIVRYLRERNLLFTFSCGGIVHKPHRLRKMCELGYQAGVPDLLIFEPRTVFHGLAIEVKCAGGRLRDKQRVYLADLNRRGYKAVCVYSFERAIKVLEEYLNPMPQVNGP